MINILWHFPGITTDKTGQGVCGDLGFGTNVMHHVRCPGSVTVVDINSFAALANHIAGIALILIYHLVKMISGRTFLIFFLPGF